MHVLQYQEKQVLLSKLISRRAWSMKRLRYRGSPASSYEAIIQHPRNSDALWWAQFPIITKCKELRIGLIVKEQTCTSTLAKARSFSRLAAAILFAFSRARNAFCTTGGQDVWIAAPCDDSKKQREAAGGFANLGWVFRVLHSCLRAPPSVIKGNYCN